MPTIIVLTSRHINPLNVKEEIPKLSFFCTLVYQRKDLVFFLLNWFAKCHSNDPTEPLSELRQLPFSCAKYFNKSCSPTLNHFQFASQEIEQKKVGMIIKDLDSKNLRFYVK